MPKLTNVTGNDCEAKGITWNELILRWQICARNGVSGKKAVKSTKNTEWRNAHISGDLKEVLLKLKRENPSSETVLPRVGGWSSGNAGIILRSFLSRVGIERNITFHTLRACFATHVLASGAEPTQVMKMGGWADFKIFQIYIRMAGVDVKGVTDDFRVTPRGGLLDNVIRLKK